MGRQRDTGVPSKAGAKQTDSSPFHYSITLPNRSRTQKTKNHYFFLILVDDRFACLPQQYLRYLRIKEKSSKSPYQSCTLQRTFDKVLVDLDALRRILRRILPLVQPRVRSAAVPSQRGPGRGRGRGEEGHGEQQRQQHTVTSLEPALCPDDFGYSTKILATAAITGSDGNTGRFAKMTAVSTP